jgi:excisionase family DNA binding protein
VGDLLLVERAALDHLLAAVVDLERQARVSSPRVREALAGLLVAARPVAVGRSWLSMAETADVLGLSVRTVRRRVASGELPSRRSGRRVLIPSSVVDS